MFETVADYRRLAERLEEDLTRHAVGIAACIDPPYTISARRKIRSLVRKSDGKVMALHHLWTAQMMTAEARSQPFGHPDRLYFAAVNGRLQVWSATLVTMAAALSAKAQPLLADEPPVGSAVHGQLLAYQNGFERLHLRLSPTPPNLYSSEPGRHGDLPYPFTAFLRMMQGVRRLVLAQGRTMLSFLDVGCGAGLKLVQAAEFFDLVHGFDFDPDRAAEAAALVERSRRINDRAFCDDALTFDRYGDFDVIYAYKPLSDPDLLLQMERRILEQAKPGALLILPYIEYDFRFEDMGCTRLFDRVYLTGGAGQDIGALLERAGRIGTVVPVPDERRAATEGFCAPVLNALRRWGHLA